jgi:hypothetical protein
MNKEQQKLVASIKRIRGQAIQLSGRKLAAMAARTF